MSIRVMSAVWSNSPHKGAKLLVLLALADWSNDRGECDPSYTQLATKARVDRRRAIRIVGDLVADGELATEIGAGFAYSKGATSNRITLAAYVGSGKYAGTQVAPAPSGGGSVDPQGSGARATTPSGTGTTTPSGAGATHNNQLQHPTATEYPSMVKGTMDGAPMAPANDSTLPAELAPTKPSRRRKTTPPAPLQLGQGSTVYRDVMHLTPNAAQRELLDAAFERHGERHMRDSLARWLARGWNPRNVPGMVDHMDGGDKARATEARDAAFWASVRI